MTHNRAKSNLDVTDIWSMQDGKYFCLSTRHKNKKRGALIDHWLERYQFHLVTEKLASLRDDYHVWFCPHGFSAKRRISENAVASKWLYADCDGVDPRESKIRPTVVIESSPGRYVGLWHVGEPVPPEVNQAWTYLHKYDRGGWDITQVLRVPGSFNHKYNDEPRVKSIESNDVVHSLDAVRKLLPKQKAVSPESKLSKYWDKLKPKMRRELTNADIPEGERSNWIWKTAHALTDAGASIEEAASAIMRSPCGISKFGERGMRKCVSDVERAIAKKKPSKRQAPQGWQIDSVNGSDIVIEPVNWLWRGFLAVGKVNIIVGKSGVGKTGLLTKIMAILTTGAEWPEKTYGLREPVEVAYMSPEDGMGDTIIPRLNANGGDRSKFHWWKMAVNDDGKKRSLSIKNDIELIERELDNNPNIKVIFLDPVTAYFGDKGDSYKNTDVRSVITPISQMAQERGVAVVLVMHPKKNNAGQEVLQMINGSSAWGEVARLVLFLAKHPEKMALNVLAVAKNSVGKPSNFSLEYRLSQTKWLNFETQMAGDTQKFEFVGRTSLLAQDLIEMEKKEGEGSSQEDECKNWLSDYLTAEGQSFDHLRDACEKRNYSIGRDKFYELLHKMGERRKQGKGKWLWFKKQLTKAI